MFQHLKAESRYELNGDDRMSRLPVRQTRLTRGDAFDKKQISPIAITEDEMRPRSPSEPQPFYTNGNQVCDLLWHENDWLYLFGQKDKRQRIDLDCRSIPTKLFRLILLFPTSFHITACFYLASRWYDP